WYRWWTGGFGGVGVGDVRRRERGRVPCRHPPSRRSLGCGGLGRLLVGGRGLLLAALLEELALPLGEGLGLGVALRVVLLLQALGRGVGDDARQQRDRADRVVVAGDRVGEVVGVRSEEH